MMGDRRARVTAAYATVKVLDTATGKPTVYGFYEGGILPSSADPENVESLVRRGYAEWVDEPAEPKAEEPPVTPERPKQNDPKDAWVAYAVAQRADGVSEADAKAESEGKSKADLIAEYSG